MSTLSERNYLSDWLAWEQDRNYSREKITITAGSGSARALTDGMVLGKISKGTATGAAVAGNTGGSTITASPTVGADAKVGVYRLTCVLGGATGRFQVEDPDGIVIGHAIVGTQFTTHLTFTITDGTPDSAAGDAFTITVAAGAGTYQQIDFSGATGIEDAAGILIGDATAPDGSAGEGVALVRNARIVPGKLIWPAGATNNQKNAALAQLLALGIIQADAA